MNNRFFDTEYKRKCDEVDEMKADVLTFGIIIILLIALIISLWN